MRATRLYQLGPLKENSEVQLSDEAAHYIKNVLRLNQGDALHLFDGHNQVFFATVSEIQKKAVFAHITTSLLENRESDLQIHLIQGVSRGERMDFAIQKAVELGVTSVTPIFTERCNVKLTGERLNKRIEQWQKIAINACEQCGRNQVPLIQPALQFNEWLVMPTDSTRLMLEPTAKQSLQTLTKNTSYEVLIGPEGGFTEAEITQALTQGCLGIRFGPRVLRTETAALAVITALQYSFGDLA